MRFIDILLSLIALSTLAPLFLIVTIILRFTGEGEIFFLQERVGRYGKKFKIVKFATMLKNSPNMGSGTITAKNDTRILPFGRFLRKSKINELPQLINILIGEMSLIGPRPHAERDLLGVPQSILKNILLLRPGLSGLGSIVFRDEENFLQLFENPRPIYDEQVAPYKAQLEQWYFENYKLSVYFKIIYFTVLMLANGNPKRVYDSFIDLPEPPDDLRNFLFKESS